jgi:hypothetical protein
VAEPRDLPLSPRTLPEGADPLRIVAFGTSLTARGPWPDHLAARLAACLEHPVELIRIARAGANVSWAAHPDRIAEVAAGTPDIVLLEFAINDADLRDGLSRGEADALTRGLLDDLAGAVPGAALVELTMSPAHGARGLLRPGLAARYGDVVARGRARSGAVADLYMRWIALPRDQRGLADGLHPDPAIAAQVIVPPLAAHLAEGFGAPCAQDQPLEPVPPS